MRKKLFFILPLLLGADVALADSFTATGSLNLTIGATGVSGTAGPALWRWSNAAVTSRRHNDRVRDNDRRGSRDQRLGIWQSDWHYSRAE